MESSDEGGGSAGQDSTFQQKMIIILFFFSVFSFLYTRSFSGLRANRHRVWLHCWPGTSELACAIFKSNYNNNLFEWCVCVPCVARVHINNAPMESKYWMGFSVLRHLYYTFNSPHLGVMLIHRQSALQPRNRTTRVNIFWINGSRTAMNING